MALRKMNCVVEALAMRSKALVAFLQSWLDHATVLYVFQNRSLNLAYEKEKTRASKYKSQVEVLQQQVSGYSHPRSHDVEQSAVQIPAHMSFCVTCPPENAWLSSNHMMMNCS